MKITTLILLLLLMTTFVVAQTPSSAEDGFTLTVESKPFRLSGEKDRFHSLDLYLMATLNPDPEKPPKEIELTLVSVVKAKKLNSDLYVVFVVDDKDLHFSSNRSAIKRPVPGRTWVGERIVFKIPFAEYLKIATAEKLAVKFGNVVFDFDERAKAQVRGFVKDVKGPEK